MVYRGKPSENCYPCRRRRIKCDRLRPHCSQCLRIRTPCSGYRVTNSIFIQQEIAVVPQSDAAHKSSARLDSPSDHESVEEVNKELNQVAEMTSTAGIMQGPSIYMNDYALAYFANVYVPASHFDYLHDKLQAPSVDPALRKAVTAAAVAAFSLFSSSASTWERACEEYAGALRLVHVALASPAGVVKDDTLAAILLLSLFEAVSHQQRHIAQYSNWKAHVEGATRLLCLRGRSQLENEFGRQLFVHVSASIQIIAAEQRIQLPDRYVQLRKEAMQLFRGSNFSWRLRFLELVEDCATLRSQIECASTQELGPLIVKATDLDRNISNHFRDMPKCWTKCATRDLNESPLNTNRHWPYSDLRIPQIRDASRMLRILLNDTIYSELAKMQRASPTILTGEKPFPYVSMMYLAKCNVQDLALEIYAHIPQSSRLISQSPSSITLPEAFSLLWPLVVVAESQLVSPTVRELVIDQLGHLGEQARLGRPLNSEATIKSFIKEEPRVHMLHIV